MAKNSEAIAFSHYTHAAKMPLIMHFRPYIEGLRGIAILLVVAAHANTKILSGGFVGVDVFFVLSGFLISGLLTQEFLKNGKINLVNFYAGRVKRLAPALLLMLFVTSIAVLLFFAPYKQLEQLPSAQSAALWYSNLYFAFADFGYFDSSSSESLFLHTWSLGVEEQFYLVWPTVLLLLTRNLGGASAIGLKMQIGQMMLKLFVVLLGVYVVATLINPIWSFYLMPTRAWEFALGASIFFLNERDKSAKENGPIFHGKYIQILGWLGFILIVGSAMYLDEETEYLGLWLVLPAIGTALVLFSGEQIENNSGCVGNLLSLPPLRQVGKISYSWYLWHWPVIVLGGNLFGIVGGYQMLITVLISLLIAIASWKVFEFPIRQSQYLISKPGFTILYAIILSLISVSGMYAWSNKAIVWRSSPEQSVYAFARRDVPRLYHDGCDGWYESSDLRFCVYGRKEANKTVVLIGDSIGVQWFNAIAAAYQNPEWKLVVLTKSSCPIIDEPYFLKRIGRIFTNCQKWRDSALSWIQQTAPEVVFMGNAKVNFDQDQWTDGTIRILDKLTSSVGQVYVMRPTPILSFGGGSCLATKAWQNKTFHLGNNCFEPVTNKRDDDIFMWLKSSSNRYTNAKVIDMNPYVCPKGICSAWNGKLVVFRDQQHITASFSESLMPKLKQEINAP